jgi:hypothetical protein
MASWVSILQSNIHLNKIKIMKKSILFLLAAILLISCSKQSSTPADVLDASRSRLPKPAPVPVPAPTPAAGSLNVGDGSSDLTISGSYPAGSTIVVKAGTYNKGGGISISGLSNVTIQLTGVILDGLNQTQPGFYNVLKLDNLTNVTIVGGTTQNCGYHQMYINSRCVGLVISGHTFSNNLQGFQVGSNLTWDGTDNTVFLLNSALRNCSFINNPGGILQSGNINGTITDLTKNLEVSGCTITGGNAGNYINIVSDNAKVFNNTIKDVNLNLTNDNRVFLFEGTAQVHDNTATNIGSSHFCATWSVSFGSTVETSNFYNNICSGSWRYSSFEFQEFAQFNIPGKTTKANLVINNNTCSNLNTSHWTNFNATFVDSYQFGLMGGQITLTNNIGHSWFPVPATNVFWNMAQPYVLGGNSYN